MEFTEDTMISVIDDVHNDEWNKYYTKEKAFLYMGTERLD
jgi:hypothetical protein